MKGKTKQLILDTALDLFSINGYEATSMSDIANSIGIKKASLYAHFKSKETILNSLVTYMINKYEQNSIFNNLDLNSIDLIKSPNDLINQVKKQVSFIIKNPYVSKVRKLLTIEQYRNSKLAKLQTQYSFTNVLDFGEKIINKLISNKVIKKGDVVSLASELVFPISMWISLCDRDPKKEKEAIRQIENHVMQFYKTNKV